MCRQPGCRPEGEGRPHENVNSVGASAGTSYALAGGEAGRARYPRLEYVGGDREDSSGALSGYGVANLPARYKIKKAKYVAAQIQNLLNKDYETAYLYHSPRRGAYVTVGWLRQ
ncbi:TonB-dependent receptor [Paraburkholderia sp. RL17-337-BIB-A]